MLVAPPAFNSLGALRPHELPACTACDSARPDRLFSRLLLPATLCPPPCASPLCLAQGPTTTASHLIGWRPVPVCSLFNSLRALLPFPTSHKPTFHSFVSSALFPSDKEPALQAGLWLTEAA